MRNFNLIFLFMLIVAMRSEVTITEQDVTDEDIVDNTEAAPETEEEKEEDTKKGPYRKIKAAMRGNSATVGGDLYAYEPVPDIDFDEDDGTIEMKLLESLAM